MGIVDVSARSSRERGEATSLYAKLFIDGFSKPSYVILSVRLGGQMSPDDARAALCRLVEGRAILRSKVERRLGVPAFFRHHSTASWLAEGGLEVRAPFDLSRLGELERELLSTPLDPERAFPFRVWMLQGDEAGVPITVFVVKVHHAIADAHTGKLLMGEFALIAREILAGAARPRARTADPAPPAPRLGPAERAVKWLKSASFSARVPEVSVLADFQPSAPLERLRVGFCERVLPIDALFRLREDARVRGLTSSQLLCVALLRAMHAYNLDEAQREPGRSAPETIGLMIAVTERWRRDVAHAPVGFAADTRLLNVPVALLAEPNVRALEAMVQEALKLDRDGHNDLALGLLYASRRVERLAARLRRDAPATPAKVRELHLTLSDLTVGALRTRGKLALSPSLTIESLRYLVSPVAAPHGGLLVHAYGDELRFTLLYHEGALRAEALMSGLLAQLAIAKTEAR